MLDSLISNLESDIKCDLSINELKLLYGIDYYSDYNLYKYIEHRNKYYDLVKIFGKSLVACTWDGITEDTICYVGMLKFDVILPTYNLRYIYGNLYYDLDKIYNLENLEKIYGDAYFSYVKSASGLENLSLVTRCIHFKEIESYKGLESLENVGGYHIDNIKKVAFNEKQFDLSKDTYIGDLSSETYIDLSNIKFFVGLLFWNNKQLSLNSLEKIYGTIHLVGKYSTNRFKKLREVTEALIASSIERNTKLEYVRELTINSKILDSTILPKLEKLIVHSDKDINNLIFKVGIEEACFYSVKSIYNTIFPDNMKILYFSTCNLSNIVIPNNLEVLQVYNVEQLRGCEINDSLKIYEKNRLLDRSEIEKYATIIHDSKVKKL